jgi:catechol 2,3-dioxygenase-like lactoylglutathione lyase family enzyme
VIASLDRLVLSVRSVRMEIGPVARTGATGPILSVYVRDPDGHLVEITEPVPAS